MAFSRKHEARKQLNEDGWRRKWEEKREVGVVLAVTEISWNSLGMAVLDLTGFKTNFEWHVCFVQSVFYKSL